MAKIISKPREMIKQDWKKTAKAAAFAFGSAATVTVYQWMASGNISWETFFTLCVPATLSTGAHAVYKWWTTSEYK